MEFFYVVKATQKSGKEDAVIWFTAKSEARANLQLDVELEDAGIETGRGKDYVKPVRTDFPVYNDLPEESTVDYTWGKRYELQDDGRTWLPKAGAESTGPMDNTAAPDTTVKVETIVESVPLENRTPAVRFAVHLTSDKYQSHITKEQQLAASEMSLDEGNTYLQNLLLAKNDISEVAELSLNAEWKLVQAIKQVFAPDEAHETEIIAAFMADWARADGYVTDRGEGAHHTLDTLDLEIACALLPMDFHHFEIPSSVLRRAKEIVAKKEDPWKSWSAILRNQPGILAVNRAAIFNLIRIAPENIHRTPAAHLDFVNKTMTAEFNSAVELLPLPAPAVETETPAEQPRVENLGSGVFSIDGLMGGNTELVVNTSSNEVEKTKYTAETTSDVQMETAKPEKDEDVGSIPPGEGTDATDTQAVTVAQEEHKAEPVIEYPAYFEPGRYEGLPNDVYHAANGISSTQVKDARVSLMYFNARHVAKTIPRTESKVLDMGNLVHALALQPETLDAEFSVEPEIPEGAFTTTATLREFIDAYNASLPTLLSADEIKALLEEHNASLPAPVPLGASLEETAQSYMDLPAQYQRIEEGQKQTATAMKACIKEYNATLPVPVKTSGSRDALLEQLAIINPDLVAQEAQKPTPLKVSGSKADMIQAVKSVKPDAIFADELLDAWRANPGEKILVTRQQLATARAIQSALLAHPTAGMLLTHPSRAVEVSYFGFDEETGLEVRVRPDLEIDLDGVRIGADLKTISMWNVKQESLRARLHREIIDRDYHLSAAMYCETAALDQFFWIFVNKDENYHWIAIIEASTELLELGMLEYRKTMRAIATGFDTGEWPAPITTDYTDELNDFDLRRLEALRAQA